MTLKRSDVWLARACFIATLGLFVGGAWSETSRVMSAMMAFLYFVMVARARRQHA